MNENGGDGDEEYRTRTGLEPPTFAAGTVLGNIGGVVSSLDDLDGDDVLDREGNGGSEEVDVSETGIADSNGVADLKTDSGNGDAEIVTKV